MDYFNLLEPIATIVVIGLTGLNWLISQKVKILENNISILKDNQNKLEVCCQSINEIKGKLDIIATLIRRNLKD